MKSFKKLFALVLSVALISTAITAGTIAYLQDEDSDVNVMTLGNVKIEQIEQERNENGELVDFTQAKPAYPAVGEVAWDEENLLVNGVGYKVFDDGLKNVVDKVVTVKNTGKSDAYVRTIVAIEAPDYDPQDLIHFNYNDTGVKISSPIPMEINGTKYVTFVFTYEEALGPKEVSAPSLMQLFLDSKADNEFCEKFGETWEVLVASQAVQVEGFENAQTALDTAFGEVNAENLDKWFGGMNTDYIFVYDAQTLKDAMLIKDAKIILVDDIVLDENTPLQWGSYMFVANGREVTINLNGKTITVDENSSLKTKAVFTTANGGTLNIIGNGTVEVKNAKSGIFHAMNKNDQINVYDGTYISNSENGKDALAIIYTNSGNVDVYGGEFVPADGIECANAEDNQGNRLSIVFHEGALLKNDKYYAGADATRIQLEKECSLKEVVVNGETWYQVAK